MATPLIRIPQEQGGTMYAFSSAARDLTRAYYNPDIVFEYSKFALLDLPVIGEPSQGSQNNYIQFDKLYEGGSAANGGAQPNYTPFGDGNRDFANTFQNYALNLENFILSDDDFDNTIYSSDSEKIFFKWLNQLGAFRTVPATSQQASSGFTRFVEEEDSTQSGTEYSKVVRYIGNVDVSNDKNYNGDTYNEIFVNVPSSVGYTPTVLFKSSEYNTTATSYLPGDSINGRSGQTHPDPYLNLDPLADSDDGTISIDTNSNYNYGIEWSPAAYSKIVNDKNLNDILDYSKRGGDFRFNAILVYYDLYSKSNPGNRSTNLYGVILLDNWKSQNGGWYIPELSKYKPNEITGLNGNAFALKLNVKFNSSLDNVGVEKNINDYSTFSMDIFFDSTTALENAAKVLADASHRYNDLSDRLNELENLFLTAVDRENLTERINELEQSVNRASVNFDQAGSILDLISSTNARLNDIISGKIPTEVQYNTDVVAGGDGTLVDKSVKNKIKIHNTNYGYALNEVYAYDINSSQVFSSISHAEPFDPQLTSTQGLWTRFKQYENLVRIYLDEEAFASNLNIYLDDSAVSPKLGQVIKLVFRTPIKNLDNNQINIYTEKKKGWILKGTIDHNSLLSNKPYIELI